MRPVPELDAIKEQIDAYLVRRAQSEYVGKLRQTAKIERLDAPVAPPGMFVPTGTPAPRCRHFLACRPLPAAPTPASQAPAPGAQAGFTGPRTWSRFNLVKWLRRRHLHVRVERGPR